jgi:hypothetical protein
VDEVEMIALNQDDEVEMEFEGKGEQTGLIFGNLVGGGNRETVKGPEYQMMSKQKSQNSSRKSSLSLR